MGKKSRTKGASGEREVVKIARDIGFHDAHRAAPMQAGYGQKEIGEDYPDVAGVGNLDIECKRYKKVPVNKFANEFLGKRREGRVRVLAYRDDNQPWRVVLDIKDFLAMFGAVHGGEAV